MDRNAIILPGDEAIIADLPVSDGMKNRLNSVRENLKGTRWGLPTYVDNNMSFIQKRRVRWTYFNLWAMFFGLIYYLVKGMWRKAISLVLTVIALSAFLVMLQY